MKSKSNSILIFIFLITVLPTIYVYGQHAGLEWEAYDNAKTDIKKAKTLGESITFLSIALGYIIITLFIIITPQFKIPYVVAIVGTVAVVILYWMRMYGIPVPGTEYIITDLSSDWRDAVTKICQQILVIPLSMILGRKLYEDALIKITSQGNREGCESESN